MSMLNRLWLAKQLVKDPGALYTHAGCATAGGPEGENLSNAGEKFPFVSSRRSSKCGKPANARCFPNCDRLKCSQFLFRSSVAW